MEKLEVFDCSNTFIASYFTDDRGCAHCNREHTLIYIHSGELEITDSGRKTILHPGDCAFMRRDNTMWLQKRVKDGTPYRSVVMKFSRDYLKEFFHTLNRRDIPADARREKRSLVKFPANVKHWHGAAKDSWFAHLAFSVPGENTENIWLEPVTDEEYNKL